MQCIKKKKWIPWGREKKKPCFRKCTTGGAHAEEVGVLRNCTIVVCGRSEWNGTFIGGEKTKKPFTQKEKLKVRLRPRRKRDKSYIKETRGRRGKTPLRRRERVSTSQRKKKMRRKMA